MTGGGGSWKEKPSIIPFESARAVALKLQIERYSQGEDKEGFRLREIAGVENLEKPNYLLFAYGKDKIFGREAGRRTGLRPRGDKGPQKKRWDFRFPQSSAGGPSWSKD